MLLVMFSGPGKIKAKKKKREYFLPNLVTIVLFFMGKRTFNDPTTLSLFIMSQKTRKLKKIHYAGRKSEVWRKTLAFSIYFRHMQSGKTLSTKELE